MNTRFKSVYEKGTRLVLAFVILTLVFVQTFGIAPKDNPAYAQSADQWEFVGQSVNDGTCYTPNTTISVTWNVKNAGNKAWQNYTFVGGPSNTSSNVAYTNVQQSVSLTTTFTTPSTVGDYRVDYKLVDETGSTVNSTRGSTSMWLSYKVAENCNASNSAPVQNSDNQATAVGGHWVEVAEQSHMVCKWQTIFGCWWSEKVIDVPASRTWVPDPVATTPPPAIIQHSAPAETQPPVATAQVAPSGPCTTVGETQIGEAWTVVCLGGNWVNAVTDPSGNTVVPVQAPTAPAATPIPNAPTSFNGVSLPSTASSVISGGGVFMYMFAGTMSLPANYVLVAEGTAYTTLSAAGTTVVSTIAACATPLVVIGIAVFTAYGISALVAVPATITHPPAIAVPVAPIITLSSMNSVRTIAVMGTLYELESLTGINITSRTLPVIEIGNLLTEYRTFKKTVPLGDGVSITIEYTNAGNGICETKSQIDVKFPWKTESFFGFDFSCGDPWSLAGSVTDLLRNFTVRIIDLVKKGLLTVPEVQAIVEMYVIKISALLLAILKALLEGGF